MVVLARFRRFILVGQTVWFSVLRYKFFGVMNKRTDPEVRAKKLEDLHRRHAEWLYSRAVKMKGIFIKVLQLFGTQRKVLPSAYIETLSRLHDEIGPHPFAELEHLVVEATGGPIDEIFSEFETEAVAAASVAQVHKATLKNGEIVAVKIQYPGVADQIRTDLKNGGTAIGSVAKITGAKAYRTMFDLLSSLFIQELDFANEIENLERSKAGLGEVENVVVPKPYSELSSAMVLVMEWTDGIKITDIEAIDAAGLDRRVVLERVIDLYMKQVFELGFFHGDPHPGNLFLRANEDGPPTIVFLDFGLCHALPDDFRINLGRLMMAAMSGKKEKLDAALTAIGFETKKGHFESLKEVAPLFINFATDVAVREDGEVSLLMMPKMQKDNLVVKFPKHFPILMRVLLLVGGLAAAYGLKVDLLKLAQPYVSSLITEAMAADAEAAKGDAAGSDGKGAAATAGEAA